MTNQPRDLKTILAARIGLIQSIAAANCECLRLNQIASGLMILDQKDETDGVGDDRRDCERTANEAAVEACLGRIATLEGELADLDRELATLSERQPR